MAFKWQIVRPRIRYVSLCLVACLFLGGLSTISAQNASSIAQGFKTDDPNVVSGALVGLKDDDANTVELSNQKNVDNLLGVVSSQSLIELSDGAGSVQIVTSGSVPTLVSDINGTIKIGDKITASPISGIGMKATTSTFVVGTAQANLSSVKTEKRIVADKTGKQRNVKVGSIPVQVDKVFYEAPDNTSSYLPPMLQTFANNVAGRQVSPLRILVASLLIVLLFIIVGVLLYSAVHSSIISIGRNPLSGQAVHKSLLEVGITVLGVLVFSALVIYLILTL